MGNAKKEIEALVKKKAKQINELRTNSSKKMSYEDIVFKFFKDMENTYKIAKDNYDFETLLTFCSRSMQARLESIDLGCSIKIIWNDADEWTELRVLSVEITWSDNYLRNFPEQTDKTVYVNISDVLMAGLP